jgi:predicted hexulose-6-phosphate isomerase
MEISIDETDKKLARLDSKESVAEIKAAIEKTGVPILTMCLSGHRKYPFGSHDEKVRARSLQIMEKAIDFAAAVGIRIIQLAGYDVYYEEGDADTLKWFEENLDKAVKMAARKGVLLGFETMETPFLDTVGKGMVHVNRVNSPYLGMYPDIGNLKNAALIYGHDVAQDLALGKAHTFASHLKETKPGLYRDMLFGQADGHTEYDRCLAVLCADGVGMFTGEFWYHGEENYLDNIRNASAFLREKIEAAL